MKNVLVLGGSGLLGSELIKLSNNEFNFVKVDRTVQNIDEFLEEQNPVAVVNSVASLPNANEQSSYEANYQYPLRWIDAIRQKNSKEIKWIQVSSYFELQQKFGRHDSYTNHKALIRRDLAKLVTESSFQLTSIFMPYLAGLNERTNRIIPTLLNIPRTQGEVILSSGTQYLPVLTAIDAAKAVYFSLETDQLECSATPVWYSTVRDLVNLVSKFLDVSEVVFNNDLKALDASFPRVDFPDKVRGWNQDISLEDFIKISLCSNSKFL